MRVLLWILLLLCVFGAVSLYHSRFTENAREDRAEAHAAAVAEVPLPEGFNARVIVGEQSGAPLVEGVPVVPRVKPDPNQPNSQQPGTRPSNGGPSSPATTTEHVIARGDSLSKICARYYGTSRPELVNALAKFNNLKSPNDLREGRSLAIPPLAALGVPAK